jgi:hypothetical protein
MIHISSDDEDSDVRPQLKNQIKEYWDQGKVATNESVAIYRLLWKAQQPALKRISGAYSSSNTKSKAPIDSEIMSMSWQSFSQTVHANNDFNERCNLLDLVRIEFNRGNAYSTMKIDIQKTIAGLPNNFCNHSGWFGSMKGAGYFKQQINVNNIHLSNALDSIPLDGAVTYEHYNSYISEFIKAFPNGGHGVGIASRLLALKRPDYFLCLTKENETWLCTDFNIKKIMNDKQNRYERYWDEVICRIMDSVWWNEPKPTDNQAIRVWLGRAAMIDAL